jgi:hypothetical protein
MEVIYIIGFEIQTLGKMHGAKVEKMAYKVILT